MLVSLFSLSASAGTGPFPVGWADRVFDDPQAGTVAIRVYYPALAEGEATDADPTSGPFPLAAFLHGWLGSAWMYDGACNELASYGYVVGSLDTETGLFLDMENFADDAVAMLHALEARSDVGTDPLAGMISQDSWTALGHSMGGATLGRLLGIEPRIRTAVAFMPYEGEASYYEAVRGYDGALLVLSGTNDTTAPPALQREWMDAADLTSRSLMIQITDMGHQAVTDLLFEEDPIPDAVQLEIVSRLGAAFVRAEQGGDEDLWGELLGPVAPDIERSLVSRSHDPALFATVADGRVSLGVAGLPGSTGEVFFGATADLLDVPVATLDLPVGVAEATVDVPEDWAGDLHVAVRLDGDDGEVWTRSVALVAATEPPSETEEPPADTGDVVVDEPPPADEDGDPATDDGRGCSTVPAPLSWLLPSLVLVALRRRRG